MKLKDNQRRFMKKALPFVAVAVISVLVTATSFALFPTNTKQTEAATPTAFSHENCQYPDRWSNPVDGCDNSDPAVPECIKGMSTQAQEQACIDAFVAQHNAQKQTPATTQPTAPVVTTPAPAPSTCK